MGSCSKGYVKGIVSEMRRVAYHSICNSCICLAMLRMLSCMCHIDHNLLVGCILSLQSHACPRRVWACNVAMALCIPELLCLLRVQAHLHNTEQSVFESQTCLLQPWILRLRSSNACALFVHMVCSLQLWQLF